MQSTPNAKPIEVCAPGSSRVHYGREVAGKLVTLCGALRRSKIEPARGTMARGYAVDCFNCREEAKRPAEQVAPTADVRPEDAGRVVDVDQARREAKMEDDRRYFAAIPVRPTVAVRQRAEANLIARPGLVEPITGGKVFGPGAWAMSTGTINRGAEITHLTAAQTEALTARCREVPADVPVIAILVGGNGGNSIAIGVFANRDDARLWWRQPHNRVRGEVDLFLVPAPPVESAPITEAVAETGTADYLLPGVAEQVARLDAELTRAHNEEVSRIAAYIEAAEAGPVADAAAPVDLAAVTAELRAAGIDPNTATDSDCEEAAETYAARLTAARETYAAGGDSVAAAEAAERAAERVATGSAVVAALESAWRAVQGDHADLPDVVVITGSGAKSSEWGYHWPERWVEGAPVEAGQGGGVTVDQGATDRPRRAELFISGERLACGARLTFQTLLHEAAHALAHVRGVKDTSRQGRYHNREFVRLAESLGLHWPAGREADKTIGFSAVELRDETATRYAEVINRLASTIRLHLTLPPHMGGTVDPGALAKLPRAAGGAGGGKSRNLPVAVCQCPDPRKLRMARATLERDPVICGGCREEFRIEDAD